MGPPLNSRLMQGDAGVARDLIDGVNRRDLDDFLELLQPDVEWDDREGWPGIQGVYSGPDGVRDWWARFRRRLTWSREAGIAAAGHR